MSGAHLHLILNHVPVVGSVFALLLLLWGLCRRSDEVKRASFGATVLVALLTIPTYLTGEPAWEDIMGLPGDNDPFIESHQSAAQYAFGVAGAAGLVALVGLTMARKQKPVSGGMSVVVMVLLLATLGLMGWVANLGGMIRHTEIRHGAAAEATE
jgi:putative effector of murein hydrolase LrgA (UPF0299 family)